MTPIGTVLEDVFELLQKHNADEATTLLVSFALQKSVEDPCYHLNCRDCYGDGACGQPKNGFA